MIPLVLYVPGRHIESVRASFLADGLLSEEKQRVAAGLVSSAAAAQDSLMQLSSFLSFESEGGSWLSATGATVCSANWHC